MASQSSFVRLLVYSLAVFLWGSISRGANFPWEDDELLDEDVDELPSMAFGDPSSVRFGQVPNQPRCKVGPSDAAWPAARDWASFNNSLGGALLKPVPPAAVCYSGKYYDAAKCNYLLREAARTRFYPDDPLTVLTEWPEGNTCTAYPWPVGNCTQGGFPVYVLNATTVRQIQLAVNFARNKNLRLVIK